MLADDDGAPRLAPTIIADKVTGLDLLTLSAMAGRQLPIFSLVVPVWLVWVMAGWRGVVGVWPALVVCGGSFALVQFLVSNYHGPWLVDVAGGLVSLASVAILLRFWQPREIWHFADEQPPATPPRSPLLHPEGEGFFETSSADLASGPEQAAPVYTRWQVFSAWVPWALLSLLVAAILIRSGWTLVRDSGLVLLEGVPMHIDRNAVARDLERAVPGLDEVHHMHIWSLDGRRMLATLHARLGAAVESEAAIAAIKARLSAEHAIDHATVEVERAGPSQAAGPPGGGAG